MLKKRPQNSVWERKKLEFAYECPLFIFLFKNFRQKVIFHCQNLYIWVQCRKLNIVASIYEPDTIQYFSDINLYNGCDEYMRIYEQQQTKPTQNRELSNSNQPVLVHFCSSSFNNGLNNCLSLLRMFIPHSSSYESTYITI